MAIELQCTDGNFFLIKIYYFIVLVVIIVVYCSKYIISLYCLYYFIVLNAKIKPLILSVL